MDPNAERIGIMTKGIRNKVVVVSCAIGQPGEIDIDEILFRPTRQEP